jgi:hypothetical protein
VRPRIFHIKRDTTGDAGDSDYAFMKRSAGVAFWFKPPQAGLIEVVTDLQCADAHHKLKVEDEWGFSDAQVTQRHLFWMQVVKPNPFEPIFNLASEMTYDGDSEVSLDHRPFIPGQKFQTQKMISPQAVSAGKLVLIAVGCQSEDEANANDMEVHSESIFSWFIPRVQARIVD